MLKRTFISSILCLLLCSCFVTEIQIRKFKPNKDVRVFQIIDTNKVYKLVSIVNIETNKITKSSGNSFYKFHPNGRVTDFFAFDSTDIHTLNSLVKHKGMFNYDGNKIVLQFRSHTAQGGNDYIQETIIKSKKDILQTQDRHWILNYTVLNIPKNIVRYKSDWNW